MSKKLAAEKWVLRNVDPVTRCQEDVVHLSFRAVVEADSQLSGRCQSGQLILTDRARQNRGRFPIVALAMLHRRAEWTA